MKAPNSIMQKRPKLHRSSCFPPNPSIPDTRNRHFIRMSPFKNGCRNTCLTFIGINQTTFSSIAAVLAHGSSISVNCIKIFDLCDKQEYRILLNDLQLVASFNKVNIHLRRVQSFWETKDSTIIIINVQHYQLENENISTWIQTNASLVETVVSQACAHSPHATLVICTQPNELMTYVAWRTSKFPYERVFGLGASVITAYAHKAICDQNGNMRGRVNGYFIAGTGTMDDKCVNVFTNHVTINGICCSIVNQNFVTTDQQLMINESQPNSSDLEFTDKLTIQNILESNKIIYSNNRRRSTIKVDLKSRQKTLTEYLARHSMTPSSMSDLQQPIPFSLSSKLCSNWTESMIIVQIVRAIVDNREFQSNLSVNIFPINNSTNIFINHPVMIGSRNGGIEYLLACYDIQQFFKQNSLLISYEKLQRRIYFFKSKD